DKNFKITSERGEWREGPEGIATIATYHPSYILRLQGMNPEGGAAALAAFRADVRRAAERAGLVEPA
ncbi:MAG TPA: hypothetical protein VER55_08705, partial [Ardenticatenaceae bacterium]|nr:hypothetical protein [Ardenticatenaceae bacterium]